MLHVNDCSACDGSSFELLTKSRPLHHYGGDTHCALASGAECRDEPFQRNEYKGVDHGSQ